MEPVSVGVLGCGTISDAYFDSNERFDAYEVTACADIDTERADTKAEEYGLEATDPEGLMESNVEVIVNLTPPSIHAETCQQVLESGKHVYTEKPLASSTEDAAQILETAEGTGNLVGSAPDTFLGAGFQTCRSVIDEGRIGELVGATIQWVSPGHEQWHPNPSIFYKEGGGPLYDMGPYYVTALVSLLGSARRVTGSVGKGLDERTIPQGPHEGETVDVEVPTHESGVIDFADGTVATLLTSFDASGGSDLPEGIFELYGTRGTLVLPDPNRFEGPVRVRERGEEAFEEVPLTHEYTGGRGAGVADLAYATRGDWSHRTSGERANHVLEIVEGIRTASDRGEHVTVGSEVSRPEPLPSAFPETDL